MLPRKMPLKPTVFSIR